MIYASTQEKYINMSGNYQMINLVVIIILKNSSH